MKKVFKVVGKTGEDPSSIPNIDQENFINFLKIRGEAFKDKDFNNYVKPLFQQNLSIDKKNIGDEHNDNYGIEESTISYEWFIKDILKLKEDMNPILETDTPSSSRQTVKIVVDEVEPSIKA